MNTKDKRRKPNACRSCGGRGFIPPTSKHEPGPYGCGACGGTGELTVPPRYKMFADIHELLGGATTPTLRAILSLLVNEHTPVHNHGPEEGPGLLCPERRMPDGALRGECVEGDAGS